ncbi:MAG: hypothetical protein ACOYOF_16165 [Verrucomicrobiaceae bacterium]
MANEWQTHKEFSTWTTNTKPHALSLRSYAQDQIDKAYAKLPPNNVFREWFEGRERFMRYHPIAVEKDKQTWNSLREDYTVIASRLLPLLEANPENW